MNWVEYSTSAIEWCKQHEVPYYASFELTPLCNFACNMCYIRLSKEQASIQGTMLSTQQWVYLANEAKKIGTLALEITGGEAVTRYDFAYLYEQFIKLGYIINLRTNGYLIDGCILDMLKRYKPHRISITIYGASDDTYKKVCRINDGFTIVSRNIVTLKNSGFNIHLTMTVTKDNEADINAVQQWAVKNGLSVHFYGGLFTPIRGARRSIEHLKTKFDSFPKIDDVSDLGFRDIPNREYYMNPFWMCNGFGAMFSISWDGRMTLCNTMSSVWTNPFTEGLGLAYKNLYQSLKELHRPKKCEDCLFIDCCGVCPARLLSETGGLDIVNEKECMKAKYKYFCKIKNDKKSI